jgi:carbonic anhydrase
LLATSPGLEPDALVAQAVRANVRAASEQLRHGSQVLKHLIAHEGLLIVGAEYCLETGVVDFFDGVPDDD